MLKQIRQILVNLVKSHSSDMEITLGFGLGIFVGFIPVYGFQTILVLLLTLLIPKCNRISALASSNLFIPPLIPFTVGLDYIVGSFLLTGQLTFVSIQSFEDILLYLKPVFIGSALVAPVMAIISGFIFYPLLRTARARFKKDINPSSSSLQ